MLPSQWEERKNTLPLLFTGKGRSQRIPIEFEEKNQTFRFDDIMAAVKADVIARRHISFAFMVSYICFFCLYSVLNK